MSAPGGIEANLRFMVVEVVKQVENTRRALASPEPALIRKIESRDDYIDNLKAVLENNCFTRVHDGRPTDKATVDFLRAVNIVSANLERIADLAVNIVVQVQHLSDLSVLTGFRHKVMFAEIVRTLRLIDRALFTKDLSLAFTICRSEFKLDELFKEALRGVLVELPRSGNPADLLTCHNIFRYLERMGDALLNIGEAVIFAAVGEKFKIHQFQALTNSLGMEDQADFASYIAEFSSIWGTRSGCRIGRVKSRTGRKAGPGLLFKDGDPGKLVRERDNIARWESLVPGLAPKVHAFQRDGESASMLLEFLPGCTLQEVVLHAEAEVIDNAAFLTAQTAQMVWEATLDRTPTPSGFVRQLESRLGDVLRLHPSLRTGEIGIQDVRIPALAELLEAAGRVEDAVPAPFTVFIHGDCNLNNILYDQVEQRLHYIDLHRSAQADPAQDVSVLLASTFRLPAFDRSTRSRQNRFIRDMLAHFRRFAREHQDAAFEIRLALGLARSFISSTRFELDDRFASEMYVRGVYLLEKVLAHRGRPWEAFALPDMVLFY